MKLRFRAYGGQGFAGDGELREEAEGGRLHPHTDRAGTDAVVLLNMGCCEFTFDLPNKCKAQQAKEAWCIDNGGHWAQKKDCQYWPLGEEKPSDKEAWRYGLGQYMKEPHHNLLRNRQCSACATARDESELGVPCARCVENNETKIAVFRTADDRIYPISAGTFARFLDYLKDKDQDSFESTDAGPMTELEWWRRRMQRLTSITEQLKSKECRTVLGVAVAAAGEGLDGELRHELRDAEQPEERQMLLHAYDMRALVILVDGVDEAAGLREIVEAFVHYELVPSCNRLVVTSRPEGVDLEDYKTRFVVMNLKELSQEQQRNVIQMQLQGNAFFEHLVNIAECRKELDAAYMTLFK